MWGRDSDAHGDYPDNCSKSNWIQLFYAYALFVIPTGAIACGFAAASGFYLAGVRLQVGAGFGMATLMIAVAGLAQFLIYYLGYVTMTVDGQTVSDFIDFSKYMQIYLTHTSYRVGRAGQINTPELGDTGYWVAGLQFLGFLVGGLSAFVAMKDAPSCGRCGSYLQTVLTTKKQFFIWDDFYSYYQQLWSAPLETGLLASSLRAPPAKTVAAQKGAVSHQMEYIRCPSCGKQHIAETGQYYDGSDWVPIAEVGRKVDLPDNAKLFLRRK